MFHFSASALLALLLAIPTWAATPNVLMIVGDDQGFADYGFMGHPVIKTPNLDKLSTQSLVFKQGYVPASLCRASLASMVTGLYPHQHKVTSNDPPLSVGKKGPEFLAARAEMVAEFEKSPTLPKLLGAAGYVSHQSGKWWEGNACRCGGFTEGMTHGDPTKGGRHGDVGLTIGRQGLMPVFDFLDKSKADGKPFYAWYAPMMPHMPHTPPERLLSKYKDKTPSLHVAKYWAMCEWFDETIGELLEHLEKNGQAENTLVIYLHDNGWIQSLDKENYAPRSKRSQYDTGLRTPILLRWPGHVKPGSDDHRVSSIDLAPTILHAAGTKPTDAMPGVNLLDPAAVAKRDAIYGDIFTHNAVDIHNPAANLEYRWMIQDDWKLIVPQTANVPKGTIELYNLTKDPGEEMNLAESNPAKVAELTKKLDAWWPGK